MGKTLENLWDEYLMDKCALIDTDEERRLTKKASELHEELNALLNKEQENATERYVDAVLALEAMLVRKAFLKGCEFAVAFITEAGNREK